MHTDIHKGTKVDDIAHGSLQYHARCQVLHLKDIGTQDRFLHLLTGISGRFFQLLYNVL